jgi:hypothetical protein
MSIELTVAPDEDQEPTLDESETTINRDPGSGSLSQQEAWVAETELDGMNDGRYDTRTMFYGWESDTKGPSQLHRDPSDRRSWSDLSKWNDGMWEPDREIQNFNADVRRWTQTFCNQLDIPSYQYQRVEYIVQDVDLSYLQKHCLSAEHVILGAISLVVDAESDVSDQESWDFDDWIIYSDEFRDMMDNIEMEMDDLWTARKVIHSESKYFESE